MLTATGRAMRKFIPRSPSSRSRILRNVLEVAGIGLRGAHDRLGGVVGEIPFVECWPELWVRNSGEALRARGLIDEALRPATAPPEWSVPRAVSGSSHSSRSAGAAPLRRAGN